MSFLLFFIMHTLAPAVFPYVGCPKFAACPLQEVHGARIGVRTGTAHRNRHVTYLKHGVKITYFKILPTTVDCKSVAAKPSAIYRIERGCLLHIIIHGVASRLKKTSIKRWIPVSQLGVQ